MAPSLEWWNSAGEWWLGSAEAGVRLKVYEGGASVGYWSTDADGPVHTAPVSRSPKPR